MKSEQIRKARQRDRTISSLEWLKHKAEVKGEVRLYPTDLPWINDALECIRKVEEAEK